VVAVGVELAHGAGSPEVIADNVVLEKWMCHFRAGARRPPASLARTRGAAMADDARRIADLVEIHALCSRYMLLCSQFVNDRWLEVFTPATTYRAFGSVYTLDRFPALLEAAPRGQFIGNMPVVELDGDRATGQQHFIFVDQATHAMRL